jgi:hypothetical protein
MASTVLFRVDELAAECVRQVKCGTAVATFRFPTPSRLILEVTPETWRCRKRRHRRLLIQRGEHRIDVIKDIDVAGFDLLACLALASLPVRFPEPALVSGHASHATQVDLANNRRWLATSSPTPKAPNRLPCLLSPQQLKARSNLAGVSADPLAPLMDLPGVGKAITRARDAVTAVHRHPANRHRWPATAAEASVRAARASAALDGGSATLPSTGPVRDPVLAGALRVAESLGGLLGTWQRAPLQALARLHVLAAADLSPASHLGRPRLSPDVTARLNGLAQLITGGSQAPAPVLVAVVHGELLALAPFAAGNGVVARAAARLTLVSSGLDTKGLTVPEVAHLRHDPQYRTALAGFASGGVQGIGEWIVHCCMALTAGAREATSIANMVTERDRTAPPPHESG